MLNRILDLLIRVIEWVIRRPSLYVRILDNKRQEEIAGLRFEVENRSATPTSLLPEIRASFLYPSKGKYVSGATKFYVSELDRRLDPYKPWILSATPQELPPGYGFSWFLKFKFRPSLGVLRKVYLRNAYLEPIGLLQFVLEKMRFRLTGKVRGDGPITQEEYDRMKRSQGPHDLL